MDSPEYLLSQRIYKVIFIWFIPIIGAVIVLLFRKSDRETLPTTDERIKNREWLDSNERQ